MSIKVDHISYTYMPGAPYEKEALKEISLEIKKGEFIAVIGHTGSGKSTLVQHFNGLLHPTKGQVSLDGVDLAGKTKEARAARNKIGMVFQYPEQQLFAETVYEDIAFGPKNMGLPYEEIKERVTDAMRFVGLDFETFAGRSPFSLSGGQMRRVAMAGVVAMNPDYLILDEPTRGIDVGTKIDIQKLVLDLASEGMSVTFISSETDEMLRTCSRLIVMRDRKVVGELTGKDLTQAKIMSTIAGGDME